jgi:hypothetical protein
MEQLQIIKDKIEKVSVVGDHCMVLITKDGIETSEYSHD